MKQKDYNKLDIDIKKEKWNRTIQKATPKKWKRIFDALSRCQISHDKWLYGNNFSFKLTKQEAVYIKKYYMNYMKKWIKPFIENIIKNG